MDLRTILPDLTASGTQLAFVHMGDAEQGKAFFERYGLDSIPRVSDPEGMLYRAMLLPRVGLRGILNPRVLRRGFQAVRKGHGVGPLVGDGFRLGGAFLIHRGQIVRAFRAADVADHPDYRSFAH